MNINKFFDQIFCINLKHRTDRWIRAYDLFRKHKISVTRIEAVNGNEDDWHADKYPHPIKGFEGVAGCHSTNIRILEYAKLEEYKSILILEDDVCFDDDFNEKFDAWSEHVPEWDILYLGGMFHPERGDKPVIINDNLVRLYGGMMSTHAYAVNQSIYDRLINIYIDQFPYLTDSPDGFLCNLQKQVKTYAFNPPLMWQISDYSDIQKGKRDYVERFKRKII